ncbi:ROK family transcriptional regulator [Microlunatus soli]|uniref:Sugar kinase of the NBD/HSP70 family, may contain an N-terminal HTH domain n=1 Tax=Microlunatus soli TaxID=630515 RepID=A0A1H1VXV8_9ACTN|nr:ROK family transcriptional regulator [Microlunatus soli]SDS89828.1 Sugar kinase of the NBD/HSP70 family, may contain an N-terminal HTH domain [Microlunatus soli]
MQSSRPKPSLGLLRSLTDEHVLRALLRERQLTRAELAAQTGISKPTVAESVRRLAAEGLVHDTGDRSTGRGRSGSYFALAEGLGWGLAISVTAEAVEAERIDLLGDVVRRTIEPIPDSPDQDRVGEALTRAATGVSNGAGPARLATVSAADPVDRHSGRLVELPDSPFLVGTLDPAAVLSEFVSGPVTVDNDVNWAARAKLAEDGSPADFALLYLGAGLGCAIVSDREVRRGDTGLAGEISHLITRGQDSRAVHFTEVFDQLGLHRPHSSAIDVSLLLRRLDEPNSAVLPVVADAVCDVAETLIAVSDPHLIMVTGPWGEHAALVAAIRNRLADRPRQTAFLPSRLAADASLAAVRWHVGEGLQQALLTRS